MCAPCFVTQSISDSVVILSTNKKLHMVRKLLGGAPHFVTFHTLVRDLHDGQIDNDDLYYAPGEILNEFYFAPCIWHHV